MSCVFAAALEWEKGNDFDIALDIEWLDVHLNVRMKL